MTVSCFTLISKDCCRQLVKRDRELTEIRLVCGARSSPHGVLGIGLIIRLAFWGNKYQIIRNKISPNMLAHETEEQISKVKVNLETAWDTWDPLSPKHGREKAGSWFHLVEQLLVSDCYCARTNQFSSVEWHLACWPKLRAGPIPSSWPHKLNSVFLRLLLFVFRKKTERKRGKRYGEREGYEVGWAGR